MTLQSKINEAAEKYGRDHEAATLNQIRLEDAVKFGAKLALSPLSEASDEEAARSFVETYPLQAGWGNCLDAAFIAGCQHARQQERVRVDKLRSPMKHLVSTIETYFSDPDIYECRGDKYCDHCQVTIASDEARAALDADEKGDE